jgi:hypothetical protein
MENLGAEDAQNFRILGSENQAQRKSIAFKERSLNGIDYPIPCPSPLQLQG